jgi:hypothetical protein
VQALTTFLICFDTSSIPKVSLEMATDMSSLAGCSCVFGLVAIGFPVDVESDEGGYGSPARMAFAYSFVSKSGLAKTEKSKQRFRCWKTRN